MGAAPRITGNERITRRMIRNSIATIQRLRESEPGEIRTRGRQEVAKLRERLLGMRTTEMSERAFRRVINRDRCGLHYADALLRRICGSLASPDECRRGMYFESLRDRDPIRLTMKTRFPSELNSILSRADLATRGRIDLLAAGTFDFGGDIDWRLEPISGRRTGLSHWSAIAYLDPSVAGDKKVTWELNRHAHFVTLGQAYYLTGDSRFATTFVSQATSWMNSNPPNRGINWASSLEVAFRSIAWLWSLHLFAAASELTNEFVSRLLKHLYEHARHIETYLSRYFSPNTHLTGEALGLFYLGVALPEFKRARRWREIGLQVLLEQLPIQVRSDGVYFEQATHYHRYTVDFYLHLILLADVAGIPLPKEVATKCQQMLDYLMWITRPDGSSPLIGDDDGGRLISFARRDVDDFRDTLALGAALFGRSDWKYVAGDGPAEILWLLGPQGLARYDRIEKRAPRSQSRAFRESGYFVMRDGWSDDSSYAVIQCGPHGALTGGHAHSAALAVEFAASGRPWVVDRGTFTYTGSLEIRNQFRETQAHNTVTVDSEPQSVTGGPFSWARVATGHPDNLITGDSIDYFTGSHDGYHWLEDPVTHYRSVLMVKARPDIDGNGEIGSYLVVRDGFECRGSHQYKIPYHLSPGCHAVSSGNRVIAVDREGRRLSISVFGRTTPLTRIGDSWASKGYLHRDRSSTAVFEFVATGPAEFVTFIIPGSIGRAVQIEERPASVPSYCFFVTADEVHDVLILGDGRRTNWCGPVSASGTLAWARFVDEKLTRAVLLGGKTLNTSDGISLNCSERAEQCLIENTNSHFDVVVGGSESVGENQITANIAIGQSHFELGSGRHRVAAG